MNSEIFQEILRSINKELSNYSDAHVLFSKPTYSSIKITKNSFHELNLDRNEANKKIVFVDGGNAEILKATNFSLHFIRVYAAEYQKNKRLKSHKKEFYCLITSFNKDNEIYYKTRIFPVSGEININERDLEFNSLDNSITIGNFRASISKIGEIARRLAEIEMCLNLTQELDSGDVIVMDGTLQAGFTNETKYLDKLYEEAIKKNIVISALSKTNNLFTNDGNSVNGLLNSLAEHKTWYYYPVAEINDPDHKAKMFFVKLNPASKHIFRFELLKDSVVNPRSIFNELMYNSSDPIFPGYPYGLIEADRFARVSNKEKDYLRTIFATKAGKEWEKIQGYLSSTNVHDILDNVH